MDCPAPGECTAAGDYRSTSGATKFFVTRAAWATWHDAIRLPGLASIGAGADLTGTGTELSCTTATCEIGGTLDTNAGGGTRGFLVGQTRGRWGAPHLLPGTDSTVTALSCPTAGAS